MVSHFGVPVQHLGTKEASVISPEKTLVSNEVHPNALAEVLRLFDGRVKAVRRSSGGLIAAEPCQIVVVNTDHPSRTNVRLRVRFKDITIEETEGSAISRCQTHTKVIALEELRDPFTYNFNNTQQFVLDVGHGIVPIHVVHYDTDPQGTTYAYFVELASMESAAMERSGGTSPLVVYRVPRAVLRFASLTPEREGKSDYEVALENHARMLRVRAQMFPDCLRFANPIEVPTGAAVQDIRDFLQLTLVQGKAEETGTPNEPLFVSFLKEDNEDFLIERL